MVEAFKTYQWHIGRFKFRQLSLNSNNTLVELDDLRTGYLEIRRSSLLWIKEKIVDDNITTGQLLADTFLSIQLSHFEQHEIYRNLPGDIFFAGQ